MECFTCLQPPGMLFYGGNQRIGSKKQICWEEDTNLPSSATPCRSLSGVIRHLKNHSPLAKKKATAKLVDMQLKISTTSSMVQKKTARKAKKIHSKTPPGLSHRIKITTRVPPTVKERCRPMYSSGLPLWKSVARLFGHPSQAWDAGGA